ncbi:hypothetical protein CBR_g25901 [Chara braunii]|uniref:CCHC-type domain-containing protein n=1 Tax=Chara braunii TaxID=69332 RepID=A0A388L6N3_CHABU|nr:hypothetical protein CBR_g25901 [Chara braunii]|eukprot:GBG77970.1 hypothetical protein CBR_g25901 [Chara braunii]
MYHPQTTPYPPNDTTPVHTPARVPTPPPPPYPPCVGSGSGECYTCGEYGYFARDCPNKNNGRQWQSQGRDNYGPRGYGQGVNYQPRVNAGDDRMDKLLLFVDNQRQEADERKKAEQERKLLEEEKQRVEEAKQREEAERRRTLAIIEATAAQAFNNQLTALEEKIRDHVKATLTVSEEKNARLHDSLQRFLERADPNEPRTVGAGLFPYPKRRLNLDGYAREIRAKVLNLAGLSEDALSIGERKVKLVSAGGEVSGEKWSIIRRLFGTSTVVTVEGKFSLVRSKQHLEKGGTFGIAPIVKTESARCRGKGYLRLLLELPRKQAELKYFDVTKFVYLYRCAREFKTKITRRTLKEKIAAVIKKKTGVNVRLKVNVGVKYNHQLRKRKIRDTVVLCVEKCKIHPVLKSVLRHRVRVVWKKNKTVEQVLANHREVAKATSVLCNCSNDKLPREDGHVLARISQCPGVPPTLHNGKNILQGGKVNAGAELQQVVECSLMAVMEPGLVQMSNRSCFESCTFNRVGTVQASSEVQANKLAATMNHLVVVPVDRNPGDLVVMCPSTYHFGLQMMFSLNATDQQNLDKSETEVLAELRAEYKRQGLDEIGAWNPAAKLGQAFVLAKNKDLTRWRPIASACTEGSRTTGRRLAHALNYLLERAPRTRHFNLKATAMLKQNLDDAGWKISVLGDRSMVLVASYDIKEMFTSLPHRPIAQVVHWLLQLWEKAGVHKLSLSRRGRVVVLNRKSLSPGYVELKFSLIAKMVGLELSHTYISCRAVILKQLVGIPMGKNSSLALACLLCAKYEVDFLSSLGGDQRLVHGVRLVDDVMLVVACDMHNPVSIAKAKGIRKRFERAYGEQLTLVQTDDDSNSWDFLGTRAMALP